MNFVDLLACVTFVDTKQWILHYKASQCLKITEKVSFNILSGQKLVQNAKNGPFWRVLENLKLAVKQYYQRQVSFDWTKIGGKCQNTKIQMRHFEQFLNNVFCIRLSVYQNLKIVG